MLAALAAILGPILGTAAERLIPDPAARQKWVAETLAMFMQADLGQLEVNKAEAQHSSLFVAGWRPAIGWICAAALAYSYVIVPFGLWVAQVKGFNIPKPPVLDNNLWELVMGMLGMGALRTFEKVQKINGK